MFNFHFGCESYPNQLIQLIVARTEFNNNTICYLAQKFSQKRIRAVCPLPHRNREAGSLAKILQKTTVKMVYRTVPAFQHSHTGTLTETSNNKMGTIIDCFPFFACSKHGLSKRAFPYQSSMLETGCYSIYLP